jgi:hypothetical protein
MAKGYIENMEYNPSDELWHLANIAGVINASIDAGAHRHITPDDIKSKLKDSLSIFVFIKELGWVDSRRMDQLDVQRMGLEEAHAADWQALEFQESLVAEWQSMPREPDYRDGMCLLLACVIYSIQARALEALQRSELRQG